MSPENDSRKILTQALMNLHQQLDRPKNSREPVAILRPHRPDAGLRDDLPRYSR